MSLTLRNVRFDKEVPICGMSRKLILWQEDVEELVKESHFLDGTSGDW